ncbi:MAG: CBS domain-containing protein [Gammaproteobacteria bacterium]|jgi:magnesium and cobalt transporter|nr:CBS domain-containing protein [Gammaproteobacteria bacterium]
MSDGQSGSDSGSSSWIGKLSNIFTDSVDDTKSLVKFLRKAEQNNVIDADGLSIIEGALQVTDMQVREIMIPRSQVATIDITDSPDEIIPKVIEAGHSRFPVIGESKDDVVGILLAKDLLELVLIADQRKFNLKDVLRPAIFVPESKRLNILLKEFRENRNHMAIVIDEYGGMGGVVTIEDVLEQIVGEIEDEFDVDEEDYIKVYDKDSYTVKALTPIEDFNAFFHSNLPDNEFDTIGGLVVNQFRHIPGRDESVGIGPYLFRVLSADNRQIRLLQVTTIFAASHPG